MSVMFPSISTAAIPLVIVVQRFVSLASIVSVVSVVLERFNTVLLSKYLNSTPQLSDFGAI